MLTAEARVETERPTRYLRQLCRHFDNKGRHLGHRPRTDHGGDAQALREMRAVAAQAHVEWSDTQGSISLPWGLCALEAEPDALVLGVEAVDEENLRRLQDLVAGHVERFGRRDRLKVTWQQHEASTVTPGETIGATRAPEGGAGKRRRHLRTIGLTVGVAVVVAVHVGVGGAVLADWRWTGTAVGAVLVVVLAKLAVVGRFALHRGKSTKSR